MSLWLMIDFSSISMLQNRKAGNLSFYQTVIITFLYGTTLILVYCTYGHVCILLTESKSLGKSIEVESIARI